jgi:hypothetical protein
LRLKAKFFRAVHLFLCHVQVRLARTSDNALLHSICTGHVNTVHTLTDPKFELENAVLRAINHHFLVLKDAIWDEGENETYPFFIRAYSSWRSAVKAWASGALPETFTLLRVAIENAAHGNHLRSGDTELFERWVNRHANPKYRIEFTFRKALVSLDSTWSNLLDLLYDLSIDRGAHPNPLGTWTGMRTSSEGLLQVAYQGGTEREMFEIADHLSLAGIGILQTFKQCYAQCYEAAGVKQSVAVLTLKVIEIAQKREELREAARLEEVGAADEPIGWVKIVRENDNWGEMDPLP